jgi:hypothetical protein
MTSLGRNFDFRQSPLPQHRLGRFRNGATAIAQGAPVTMVAASVTDPADLRLPIQVAAAAAPPVIGISGIVVYEAPWDAFHGYDSSLTLASDIDLVPALKPCQVVHGTEVRVKLTNTVERSFEGQRTYAGRVMVAPANLSTLIVGDLLTPGVGNGTAGYWAETATLALAWLRVTSVQATAGFVEAQMLF